MNDADILQAIRAGSESAFKEFVKRYEPRVAATVIGMLGRCPEADDVGQETFIRFFLSIHKFRGDADVSTYLTRIAINLSLNELKRRKRSMSLFSRQTQETYEIANNDDEALESDEKELVHRAIQQLEPKFRSVIVLRLIDGYSTEETAKILKLPTGTVLSRLSRAQQKLKHILSPYLGEMA